MNKETKIFLVILGVVLVSFSVVTVTTVDPVLLEMLDENREYLYASKGVGTSMHPFIENGDIIVVLEKESPVFFVSVGDVLVYGKLYRSCPFATSSAHRVIHIENDVYTVKGDNLDIVEEVSEDEIIGKVVSVVGSGEFIKRAIVSVNLGSSQKSSFTII